MSISIFMGVNFWLVRKTNLSILPLFYKFLSGLLMIGKQIKNRRKELDITQQTLALLAGVSKNTIYQIEREQSNPTLEIIQKLADVLGMRINLEVKK